ncbi:MAG: hypothetical protein KC468_17305 [Myxococcales bacterium]|nr:hypothetical protein [Myxococcales bacterium]
MLEDSRLRALRADAELLDRRVELGELTDAQLRLAAYLGLPAAAVAIENRIPADDEPIIAPTSRYAASARACAMSAARADFTTLLWLRGLGRWGTQALVRAGILGVRALVAARGERAGELVDDALAIIDDWLAAPDPDGATRLLRLLRRGAPRSLRTASLLMYRAVAEVSRDLVLDDLERELARELQLAPLRAALARWALSPQSRDRLDDDRPRFLPDAPSFREQVIAAETPVMRLRIVDALQRCVAGRGGERVAIVFVDGRSLLLEPRALTLQRVDGVLRSGPTLRLALDDVLEVHAPAR